MANKQYKALTVIELSFTGKTFRPGDTISHSDFEESAKATATAVPDAANLSADEQIAKFIEDGALSDDLDAPLHPDHVPVDPRVPTLVSMVAQAQFLVEELEKAGKPVPAKIRAVAEMNVNAVNSGDKGSGGDKNV